MKRIQNLKSKIQEGEIFIKDVVFSAILDLGFWILDLGSWIDLCLSLTSKKNLYSVTGFL